MELLQSIGAGSIARAHAIGYASAPTYCGPEVPPVRLAWVADADEAVAKAAAARLGFEAWTTDWERVAASPDVDLVSIVTPNFLHAPMAIAAAQAGKHVFCEKPLATSAAEGERMYRAAAAAGIVHAVNFNYRKVPAVRFIARLIREGRYHIVHTHASKAGVLGRIAAKLAGTPLIVHTLHSLVFHEYQPWVVNRAWWLAKKVCAPLTDHFISVSSIISQKAIAAGIDRPAVSPDGRFLAGINIAATGQLTLVTMPLDGSGPPRVLGTIAPATANGLVEWTASGDGILYSTVERTNVWLQKLSGGPPVKITNLLELGIVRGKRTPDGARYLFAYNTRGEPVRVTWTLAAPASATLDLDTDAPGPAVAGDALTVELGPYGVKRYRLR